MGLSGPLGLRQGDTVAVAGSGGKTTLILRLAAEWRTKRVLISTTTRIDRDEAGDFHYLYANEAEWRNPAPAAGIHVAGVEKGGQLHAPPADELKGLRAGFDLTLLECDNAHGLPLKGWREGEPAVPPYADVTVGVTTVRPVGRPVSDRLIYQKGLFIIMSGARLGQPVTLAQVATSIAHPKGLFRNASGRMALFINQVEDEAGREMAKELVRLLPVEFVRALDCVVAGSLQKKEYIYMAGASRYRKSN